MNSEVCKTVIKQLKEEMLPALGVTEPAAIALSTAKAYEAIGGEVKKITVLADEGVLKTDFLVQFPVKEKGNEMAAALGVIAGDSSLGLKVLENICGQDVQKAKKVIGEGKVEVKAKRGLADIFIDATVETDKGKGRAVIKDKHTNIVLVEKNSEVIFKEDNKEDISKEKDFNIKELKLKQLVELVDIVPYKDLAFVLEAVRVNKELAEEGKKGQGMKIGKAMLDLVEEGILGNDLVTYAQMFTGFAVDARMEGIAKPAMSICGSGDHGLIAVMPLIAIAEKKHIDDERLARSIVLSYLVTMYIKAFSGRLSAFCGCAVAAGTGVSAAACYLLGGGLKPIENTIENMASNITGIICDGGNFGCSFKAVTAAGAAVLSALLTLKDIHIPKDSGIVGNTVEETMQNIGKIASPGMIKTNDVILDIMINRHN